MASRADILSLFKIILQVLYARHNELRDSGIPSDLFKLEHLATLVSKCSVVSTIGGVFIQVNTTRDQTLSIQISIHYMHQI